MTGEANVIFESSKNVIDVDYVFQVLEFNGKVKFNCLESDLVSSYFDSVPFDKDEAIAAARAILKHFNAEATE